ncbi:MAG: hypothetical protein BCS36_11245 [Desulfovibrio sp. MES5]|nr:MAG: hypothetical protein BCS36_11245 [Desulfovibrio sp. MES5]
MNKDNQTDCNSPTASMPPRKTLEERKALLQRQKEKLAQKEAALNKEARKERDGQLIAWGIMVEARYRNAAPELRERIISTAHKFLRDRNLSRALTGFARLDAEAPSLEVDS